MEQIEYSKDGVTGKIIISNPKKKNAVTYEMWKELGSVLDNVKSDQDLRLLIIEGEGNNFSAGADISQFSSLRIGEKRNEYDSAIYSANDKLKKLLIPVIASVKGICFGGGFALALKCDFRIAEENAVFSLPAVKRGIGYNKESIKDLVDVVGLNNARDIL
jgi:enoyl-CoA hydratase/carnithine racemase